MATRWKNRSIFVVMVLLLTFGISGMYPIFIWLNEYAFADYYETSEFYGKVEEFQTSLNKYELNYIPMDEAIKNITVSTEEIKAYQYYYGTLVEQISNIKGQYEEKIQEAKFNDKKEEEEQLIKERDIKLADITENFENDDYVSDKIREEKEEQLRIYYKQLQKEKQEYDKLTSIFTYYFKNSETGQEFSNNALLSSDGNERSIQQTDYAYWNDFSIEYRPYEILQETNWNLLWYSSEVEQSPNNDLHSSDEYLEGYIAVSNQQSNNTEIKTQIASFEKEKKIIGFYSLGALVSLLIFCSVVYKKRQSIKKYTTGSWYREIPIDIRTVVFLTNAMIALIVGMLSGEAVIEFIWKHFEVISDMIGLFTVTFVTMFLLVLQAMELYCYREKRRSLKEVWKGTFIHQVITFLNNQWKKLLLNKSLTTRALLGVGVIAIALFFTLMSLPFEMMVLYLLLYVFLIIPILLSIVKKSRELEKVLQYSSLIVTGENPKELNTVKDKDLKELVENIHILKTGVIVSQNAQAKSERLKTELITNVSHDLRTPLTSIISYTDLLKNPQLSDEVREDYIAIIERKSQRLKVLIEDLFEVSKMASGNVELKCDVINLVQLLQQALAEYDDMIKASTLEFKVSSQEERIFAYVDGQKMWRVFDNLIGNIVKYSLENSRVYISLKVEQDFAVIQFKNISKYELDDSMDELFERFKRGDTSRNTEGSGLGLAIAKSIVDLHAGFLIIETDGDLFKATLKLKTSNQEN